MPQVRSRTLQLYEPSRPILDSTPRLVTFAVVKKKNLRNEYNSTSLERSFTNPILRLDHNDRPCCTCFHDAEREDHGLDYVENVALEDHRDFLSHVLWCGVFEGFRRHCCIGVEAMDTLRCLSHPSLILLSTSSHRVQELLSTDNVFNHGRASLLICRMVFDLKCVTQKMLTSQRMSFICTFVVK